MKFTLTTILIASSLFLRAEYDEYFYHIRVVTEVQENWNYEHEFYFNVYDQLDTTMSIEEWKRILNSRTDSTHQLYFERLSIYRALLANSELNFGTYYFLSDSIYLDLSGLQSVEVLEVHHASLLSGLYKALPWDSDDWSTTPAIDTAFFTVPYNMCERENCIDILFPTFHLFIHEKTDRTDQVIATLRSLQSLYMIREKEITEYYDYRYENNPKFVQLANAYYPMVEALLSMLEYEKVVIVYDSGW